MWNDAARIAVVAYLMIGLVFGGSVSLSIYGQLKRGQYRCIKCNTSDWCGYDTKNTILTLFAWPWMIWWAFNVDK